MSPAFNQTAYRKVVDTLDEVMDFMKSDFGKNESEAQDWLSDFVRNHYLPVWRAMNGND